MENFVLKMAAEFPSRRDQLIFLINNYDMMLGVLMVSLNSRDSPNSFPPSNVVILTVKSEIVSALVAALPVDGCFCSSSFVQERAADDSKEVEGFQQLLLARTQVNMTEVLQETRSHTACLSPFSCIVCAQKLLF